MLTVDITLWYNYLFLITDCFTIVLKVILSRAKTFPEVLAIIVAALGALYINESYPKAYPFLYVFKYLSEPSIDLKQSN